MRGRRGVVAVLLYYGAVWLVVEKVKTMPDRFAVLLQRGSRTKRAGGYTKI